MCGRGGEQGDRRERKSGRDGIECVCVCVV